MRGCGRCPECRCQTVVFDRYPSGDTARLCLACGWELSLDASGRPFDEESLLLELDLACVRLGVGP